MSAPWQQTSGFSSNTLSNPYRRLMNTSGMSFRDHAGSMVGTSPRTASSLDLLTHDLFRISARQPFSSPVTRCAQVATSCANSTRAPRTSCWRIS
jgi:hypothetical protein